MLYYLTLTANIQALNYCATNRVNKKSDNIQSWKINIHPLVHKHYENLRLQNMPLKCYQYLE